MIEKNVITKEEEIKMINDFCSIPINKWKKKSGCVFSNPFFITEKNGIHIKLFLKGNDESYSAIYFFNVNDVKIYDKDDKINKCWNKLYYSLSATV